MLPDENQLELNTPRRWKLLATLLPTTVMIAFCMITLQPRQMVVADETTTGNVCAAAEETNDRLEEENSLTFIYKAYYVGDLMGNPAMHPSTQLDAIAENIRTRVASESWNEETTIRPYPDSFTLIIRQTEAGHQQIAELFRNLRKTNVPHVPLRELRGKDYDVAREARDRGDLLRSELERLLSGPPAERPPISQEKIDTKSAEIVQAFLEVMDRYPHTEIAAYCATRLSGHYMFHGKMDKALELLEQTAKEYSGTHVENEVIFEIGLTHLQSRHDPAEAIKWLSRILKPVKSAGAEYGMDDVLYLSAQQQLIKCELQLRQDGESEDRVTKLKNTYPQYAEEIERSYQFEIEARNRSGDAPLLPKSGTVEAGTLRMSPPDSTQDVTTGTANRTFEDMAVQYMLDGLGRLRPGPDLDQAIAALAQGGDDTVAEMERQLVDGGRDYGWGHAVVLILKEINTEKSRVLMRRMALGEFRIGNDNSEGWAARNLIICDPSEAPKLLVSTNPEVLGDAINALEGQPIDDPLLALLKKCLDIRELVQHWTDKDMSPEQREIITLRLRGVQYRAAAVMASGTSGELANEAVEAIGKALTAVADLPDADTFLPVQNYHPGTEESLGERNYIAYMGTLVNANVDDRTLHNLAGRLQGQARYSVIMALGWRGDLSVHDELVKLIEDTQAGLLRARAVTVLGEIGTPEDVPFLRTLEENDPLMRQGPVSRKPFDTGVDVGPTYPVREAAKSAIYSIELRVERGGYALVVRVVDADTNEPLGKTDDGTPIRVGFMTRPLDQVYQSGEQLDEVEIMDNGGVWCYRPLGECCAILLPISNGDGVTWTRTEDGRRWKITGTLKTQSGDTLYWQSESVRIKPGGPTTLEFRVQRRSF